MPEIPGQRAHDRRQHRVQLLFVEVGDERERPLTHLLHHRVQLIYHWLEHTRLVYGLRETLRPVAVKR